MLGNQRKTVGKTILSFLEIYEDWLSERVDVVKLHLASISCFNPVGQTTITCRCLERVFISKNQQGLNAGLCKQQISNLFSSQVALCTANISPLTAIEKFSGTRNGKIQADFYDDCRDIPDPSALDPTQMNLLLLDD